MKEKIIKGSIELFLNYGFKSVTMDDIAEQLGISKKTIYQHFATKSKLVEATTMSLFETISCGIQEIVNMDKNPIEEIFNIRVFISEHLKDEKSSPQFQLKKYYPRIYASLKYKQFEVMQNCVVKNLEKGIEFGIYRSSINVDFISRIYFNCMLAMKDTELFPLKNYSMNMLMDNYLEYHLRGICTIKGLETLKQYIKPNQP